MQKGGNSISDNGKRAGVGVHWLNEAYQTALCFISNCTVFLSSLRLEEEGKRIHTFYDYDFFSLFSQQSGFGLYERKRILYLIDILSLLLWLRECDFNRKRKIIFYYFSQQNCPLSCQLVSQAMQ